MAYMGINGYSINLFILGCPSNLINDVLKIFNLKYLYYYSTKIFYEEYLL